eukprot:CAMPEP_0172583766 /NCGR_PEP_ID=MMETSP1068-20121228/3318_1 /TAXON_ID=35684 /ORGANISM="Pseudopedinella elastica, Strain CCMP716" /LENGTH=224 /DNA_ID=CAMNT_0013377671 /DNA_START=358 /DNA_END=1033 /DNA_ORIENTATION=+
MARRRTHTELGVNKTLELPRVPSLDSLIHALTLRERVVDPLRPADCLAPIRGALARFAVSHSRPVTRLEETHWGHSRPRVLMPAALVVFDLEFANALLLHELVAGGESGQDPVPETEGQVAGSDGTTEHAGARVAKRGAPTVATSAAEVAGVPASPTAYVNEPWTCKEDVLSACKEDVLSAVATAETIPWVSCIVRCKGDATLQDCRWIAASTVAVLLSPSARA